MRLPLAPIVVAKVLAPQSVGLAASADAVEAFPVRAPMKVVVERASVVALYVRPASVAGASDPVADVPRARKVVVSPAASAKVTVPAFPVTDVWSPVLVPETDTAPAPMVRTDVLAAFPTKVTVPVLTVRPVVRVALVTDPAVKPEAVPVRLVATPDAGVPSAPPEYNKVAEESGRVKVLSAVVGPENFVKPLPVPPKVEAMIWVRAAVPSKLLPYIERVV